VLDYAEEMLPEANVPYDYTSASMGILYHFCGEDEKAEHMLTAVATTAAEYLRYGSSLNREQRNTVQRTIQQQTSVLGFVLQNAERYGFNELVDEYYPVYAQYAQ